MIVRHRQQLCLALGQLDPWSKPTTQEMRNLLQLWGTEFRREQNPDYWVEKVAAVID